MALECRSTKSKYQFEDLNSINNTLDVLRRAGLSELAPEFLQVQRLRGEVLARLGLRAVRPSSIIKVITGLSPGVIKVFYDPETGWISEAIERPGAAPVRKKITDEVAVTILKGELTHELEDVLMTPDDYYGE